MAVHRKINSSSTQCYVNNSLLNIKLNKGNVIDMGEYDSII